VESNNRAERRVGCRRGAVVRLVRPGLKLLHGLPAPCRLWTLPAPPSRKVQVNQQARLGDSGQIHW